MLWQNLVRNMLLDMRQMKEGVFFKKKIHNQSSNQTIDPLSSPPLPLRNKHFEVPRNASPVFTGREEICEELQTRCLPPSEHNTHRQQKRYVIYGLGGSGKTQVCLKFAEDDREE